MNLQNRDSGRCRNRLIGEKSLWPFYDHALYMVWTYENVYLDTATVNWMLSPKLFDRMLEEAVQSVESDRTLLGSDQMVWAQMISPAVEAVRDAPFLSDQVKRNILGANARRSLKRRIGARYPVY